MKPLNILKDQIHYEPITAMALERFDLKFENDEWNLQFNQQEAPKDLGFLIDLASYYESPSPEKFVALRSYTFSVILDYLKRTHRFYIDKMLPKMEMTMRNVQYVFFNHPIANVVFHFYKSYQNELLEHIEHEEKFLFPFAEGLYDGKCTLDYSTNVFKSHHNHDIEDHLQDMLNVIEEEFPDVCASMPYRTFKHLLGSFYADLAIHHAIEERIFLPLVEKMELETKHLTV
jgi:regulator of cell morphogenesis and NO signaling